MDRRELRESHLQVGGSSLYVRDNGVGLPLVVLHGGPDFNHNYLLPELDRLGSLVRLVYYDQRGRGKSSSGVAPEDVTVESEIDDLEALRRHFGFEQMVLLGHSWGAILAMEYATRHADRASHLILMNTAPASHADLLLLRAHRRATQATNLVRMEAIAATEQYIAGDVEAEAGYYRIHFSSALHRPELVEVVVARLRAHFSPADIRKARAIEARLYAQTWECPDWSLLPALSRCPARTLLIHGESDLVPAECARHVADALPAARLVVLEGCGHFAYLERPDDVLVEIEEHLSDR
jgi:proline iminopeptidase